MKFRFGACVSLLLLSGCMIGPRYVRPCLPVQSTWGHVPEGPTCLDSEWWKQFNEPTLNELVVCAYSRNRELESAGAQVYQAYAVLAISMGEFFPQVQQLEAARSYTNLSESVATVPSITSFGDYLFNFLASWEIDLWGKFRHGIAASRADLRGSVYDYRDVLRSLISNISQTYMEICGFNQKIALLRENVRIQERTLKIVETRHKLGQSTGLDTQQALSVLETTRARLEAEVLKKKLAENFLCTLLGEAPFSIDDCYEFPEAVPLPPCHPFTGAPVDLVRSRPDVRAAEEAAKAQIHVLGITETELLPSFTLSGFFGWESEKKSDLFRRKSITSHFTGEFRWNLFNYGRLVNNVKYENAVLQELLINYQNSVINACREVEDGIITLLQQEKIVDELERAVKATRRTLELSLVQYQYGAIEFLNVLTAQTNLVEQEVALVDAQVDHVKGYISVQTALGRGWTFMDEMDFLSPCSKIEMDQRL